METSVHGTEDSSFVSFMLDQEDYTLEFGPDTTIQSIEDGFKNATYTEVEFNRCPNIPTDALCDLIPLMNSNLKSLIIRNTPWLNDECIELFTAFCNKLYKIELQGSLVNITRSGIESIARNSATLLSLSIISTDEDELIADTMSVTSKTSILSWNLDNRIFPALINNMTSKLRHFCLSGFNMLTTDGLEKFLSYFMRTLQSLDFSELNIINDSILKSIGEYCTNLFALKLNHCKEITDQGIDSLFQKKSSLEVFELCGCDKITDECFKIIAKQCPRLTVIKLDWCFSLTELSLKELANHCKKLSYVSMRGSGLSSLPPNLSRLAYLNTLNVSDCQSLTFPGKSVIEKGLHEVRDFLMEYDIENRARVTALGSFQSGKTSILLSLQSDNNVADGATFGVPVNMWFPFTGNATVSGLHQKYQDNNPSLSVELWDCSGRKALQGIHAYFLCKQSIYLVCFNVSLNSQIDKVPKIINTIQSRVPGAMVVLVASHCDLTKTSEDVKSACDRVMQKVTEEEENQIREIKEELLFLRDLGLFAMISSKRRKLEWLLENRPKIHPEVICISSLTGEGVEKLRALVLNEALDAKLEGHCNTNKDKEEVYFEIMKLKKQNVLFVTWSQMKTLMSKHDEMDDHSLFNALAQLQELGCIMLMNESYIKLKQNQICKQNNDMKLPSDSALFCINPHVFANALAAVHRDEKNVQDLVTKLQRDGHIDVLWTGAKPNDWTLRTTFSHITETGMIRESIIPLLVNTVGSLPSEQLELLIDAMRALYVLVDGAPNANYDVELLLPSMKNFSVFKRYFMPLQGLLPVIPQVNAWQPKCPPTHIQVGWDYRFVSSVPTNLFLHIISACTVMKKESETISYWQSGAYIRNGNVDVSVCQWKDKLVLQVLARALIKNGTRQAVNKAWSILTKYLHEIEMILSLFPGLYYEVLALSNSHCKPILEVVDEYEAGDIGENEALWDIPLKGCTRNTMRSSSIPPNYLLWLKSVSEQVKVHISHASNVSKELMSISSHLQSAGYEVSKDDGNENEMINARLIICLLSPNYFKEDRLLSVKNNLKEKKIILAVFEDVSVENQGYEDILLNKVKVDISGGTGTASSYQPDISQLKNLVELCDTTVFGHGSLGDENTKRVSVAIAALSNSGTGYEASSLTTKKPFEQFSDIVKQYSDMSSESEIKHVAATAVAAAVATATAEHIAKQSNPTMGAKAAAMAAEVADAVAKGDSDRASKAVIATAKAVDEVIAFSTVRKSVGSKPSIGTDGNDSSAKDEQRRPVRTKSSMCVII